MTNSVKAARAVMPKIFGYARVSTDEQSLSLQCDALRAAGCDAIFEDFGVSGVARKRPGLDAAMSALKSGDTLIVWRLDRLGRSLVQLAHLLDHFAEEEVILRSLTEGFDASTVSGKLTFHLMASLAEFERGLIGERTRAGLAAARARGRRLGRPPRYSDKQREAAILSVRSGQSVGEAARLHGVHPRTLYRLVRGKRHSGAN